MVPPQQSLNGPHGRRRPPRLFIASSYEFSEQLKLGTSSVYLCVSTPSVSGIFGGASKILFHPLALDVFDEPLPFLSHFSQERFETRISCRASLLQASGGKSLVLFDLLHFPCPEKGSGSQLAFLCRPPPWARMLHSFESRRGALPSPANGFRCKRLTNLQRYGNTVTCF